MKWIGIISLLAGAIAAMGTEFHVSTAGNDQNPGTTAKPFRTISRAAELAQPGDTITVHEGTYRERINPPRGGTSDKNRITYQAAKGEKVEIKGSEIVTGWTHDQGNVYQATVPNSMFGVFNPFADLIHGDWYEPTYFKLHTGAVYLNGEWLAEAAEKFDVYDPERAAIRARLQGSQDYLLNIAWLKPNRGTEKSAENLHAFGGPRTAPMDGGGTCLGFITDGDMAMAEPVNFGEGSDHIELKVASATDGGLIEIYKGRTKDELLATATVKDTGGWQNWTTLSVPIPKTSGEYAITLVFRALHQNQVEKRLWFARIGDEKTHLYVDFGGADPNKNLVEINVRQSVFYPEKPGINYITVRGFHLTQAATPWAPPTAEQIGLIGTHWSKGWIIEDNIIDYSACSGVALGKHGDQFDNTSANSAEGYVETIKRAHAFEIPWDRDHIGHHIVRNNRISHCEQTGIVGSMGSAFSVVTGNVIHDIHVRRYFTGAEMAGIKFHGAIDTQITNNHIYRTIRGLWLDWMSQGVRVSNNVFHDNLAEDIFMEVDHGPLLIDHNFLLSNRSVLDISDSSYFVHNLILGRISPHPEPNRETPYHPAHSTKVAGLVQTRGGDNRFFNNIIARDLSVYDAFEQASLAAGNVYLEGAKPYRLEADPLRLDVPLRCLLTEKDGGWTLEYEPVDALRTARTAIATSASMGKAIVPKLEFENPDGSKVTLDTDFVGKKRGSHPTPGPIEGVGPQKINLK